MKIPGIYVEIKGDSTALKKDMQQARQYITDQSKGMSNALNNALSPNQIKGGVNSLVTGLGTLSRSAKVTGSDFDKLGVDLKEMSKHTGLTEAQFSKLQSRMLKTKAAKSQEYALRRIANAAGLTEKEIKQMGKQFGLTSAQIKKVTTSTNRASDSMSRFGGVAKAAFAFLSIGAAIQASRAIIRIADEYTLLDSKIKLVTSGTAEFASVYSELFDISQETGSSFANNAASFSNLALVLKDSNIPIADQIALFSTLNKSLVVAGAGVQETASFMLQFKQALGSGRLAGQEFNAVMESNSYFGNLLAKTLKMNVGELKNFASENKLTTDLIMKAFPQMAQQIDEDFGSITKTISRAMVELNNAFSDVVADANKSAGGTNNLATAISNLAKTITDNKEAILSIFEGLVNGASAAVNAIAKLDTFFDNIGKKNTSLALREELGGLNEDLYRAKNGWLGFGKASSEEIAKIEGKVRALKELIKDVESGNLYAPDGIKIAKDFPAEKVAKNTTTPTVGVADGSNTTPSNWNATHQKELAYLKAAEQKKAAAIKGFAAIRQQTNQNAYDLGLTSYTKYLDEKHRLTELSLKADLDAQKKNLIEAQDSLGKLKPVVDSQGNARPDKTKKARFEALKKVEDAEKAVTEASKKMYMAQVNGAQESTLANIEQAESYKAIHVQTLEMQGKAVEAAKAQAALDEASIERAQLMAEAQSGNAEAQKALFELRAMASNSVRDAELDVISNAKNASIEIADLNGNYEKSIDLQIELLKVERERAELNGATPEELKLYDVKIQRKEDFKDPAKAFDQKWQDIAAEWGNTSNLMVDMASETASGMQSAFSDLFFDAMQGDLDSLNDYVQAFAQSVQRSIADAMSSKLTSSIIGGGGSGLLFHTGGVVGVDSAPSRAVSTSNLSSVPRYHSGLGSDEFLAVLQKKETVFTEGQMKALGSAVNSSKKDGGGGFSYTSNLTVNGGDKALAEQIERRMSEVAQEEIRRAA